MATNERLQVASRVASLTLANALIFQAELAETHPDVLPLRAVLDRNDPIGGFIDHWKFIIDEINYVPIFHLAREVLVYAPQRREMVEALRVLADHVLSIVAERAALRHDLMGRIYHRLLLEAKHLGTFYTSVPAATLLTKVSLDPARWGIDWSDLGKLAELKIADLACGTGTLLMASQQAITDNFVNSMVEESRSVSPANLRDLHKTLMEDVIHGYDVLASAIHLTASTLALLAPEIAFDKMHLYVLPFGEQSDGTVALGSVEYLTGAQVVTQLDLMGQMSDVGRALVVRGTGNETSFAPVPQLDLCIMNPPFTRSVGGNLLFGSLPSSQRPRMQTRLSKLLSPTGPGAVAPLASSTAGLGSVFVAAAHPYIKGGGTLSLVLPSALATGVAWDKTRELLARDYVAEFIIASHDSERWNFSENTDLSEILVVARKYGGHSRPHDARTVCINLWKNPTTSTEALAVADAILSNAPASIESGPGVSRIQIGNEILGEAISLRWSAFDNEQWYGISFAQTELIRVAHHLRSGLLYSPTVSDLTMLPLSRLATLGDLGPDRRDVYDAFDPGEVPTPYPALWGRHHQNGFIDKRAQSLFVASLEAEAEAPA